MSYHITDGCIGCTLCVRNCPVMAISGKVKEPHSINEKRCVNCGACANVCAKGCIVNENGITVLKIPKEKWEKPSIDTSLCSACSMCVDICTFDCLSISLPTFRGDLAVFAELSQPKKCVSCGLCEKACPLDAISMTGGDH